MERQSASDESSDAAKEAGQRPKAKAKPKPKPQEIVIKRLRRDERFYMGGQDCQTREQLIETFGRKLHFPEPWVPTWAYFERCMLDLTWLQEAWPPRRICFLEMHDGDYLLARGSGSDMVAFFTIIERSRRHAGILFEFESLVRHEAPMRRLQAAITIADRELGPEESPPFRIPAR